MKFYLESSLRGVILINSCVYSIIDPIGSVKNKTTYFHEIDDFDDYINRSDTLLRQNYPGPVKNNLEINADLFSQLLFQLKLKNSYDNSKSNISNELSLVYPTESVPISYDFIRKIEYTNIFEITSYLQNHRDIIEYVINGCRLAVNYFFPNYPIKMELITDNEGIKTLSLFIYFKEFDETKLEIIDTLNHQIGSYFVGNSAFFMISSRYS